MGIRKTRRRKRPVTSSPNAPRGVVAETTPKPKSTRTVIRRFHTLLKKRAALVTGQGRNRADRDRGLRTGTTTNLDEIDNEIAEIGGLEKYQKMSAAGQSKERGGGSEKVLVQWLKDMGLHKPNALGGRTKKAGSKSSSPEERLKLLEIGALQPDNYEGCSSWIECSPLDLRSRHPSIKEQDFMTMDWAANEAQWDIISLSLVVNFVPDARERGRMLRQAHHFLRHGHSAPSPSNLSNGLLFLVLPLPCVQNSRYLSVELLHDLMGSIGFTLIKERWKQNGKVGYWLYGASCTPDQQKMSAFGKKKVIREGGTRNNFAILL